MDKSLIVSSLFRIALPRKEVLKIFLDLIVNAGCILVKAEMCADVDFFFWTRVAIKMSIISPLKN